MEVRSEATRRPTWIWVLLGVSLGIVAVVAVLLVLAATGAFAPPGSRGPFFGFFGGFLLLFLLLWVSFFVVRVVFWTRRRPRWEGPPGYGYHDPAIVIARQRYARGEISREQYDRIMTDLSRRRSPP